MEYKDRNNSSVIIIIILILAIGFGVYALLNYEQFGITSSNKYNNLVEDYNSLAEDYKTMEEDYDVLLKELAKVKTEKADLYKEKEEFKSLYYKEASKNHEDLENVLEELSNKNLTFEEYQTLKRLIRKALSK